MILLISTQTDTTTNHVAEWLNFYTKTFIRINDNDSAYINGLTISNSETSNFSVFPDKKDEFSLKEISSVWYRRGTIKLLYHNIISENEKFKESLNNFIFKENRVISDFLFKRLESKKIIGNYLEINKLIVLKKAKESGFRIPDTLITISKKDAVKFLNKHSKIISKSIKENFSYTSDQNTIFFTNGLVTKSDFISASDYFQVTLFQEYIKKLFEIRVFVFDNSFYSMAIFSQQNEKTKFDYRNYDKTKPNRTVPFKLPNDVENNISNLFTEIGLNTGSVDLIYSTTGEYVFLEINPVGQFGNVSYHCNYYLEKKIAEFL